MRLVICCISNYILLFGRINSFTFFFCFFTVRSRQTSNVLLFQAFWKIALEEMNVSFSVPPQCILRETPSQPGGQWLPGAYLNPAKNCLLLNGKRSLNDTVIIYRDEGDDEAPVKRLTLKELQSAVWYVYISNCN